MKRPPAPENRPRITGCLLRIFRLNTRAASPYSSNIPVLSASTLVVAVCAGVVSVRPAIGAMNDGSSWACAAVPSVARMTEAIATRTWFSIESNCMECLSGSAVDRSRIHDKACGEADQLAALVFMRRLGAWLVVRRRKFLKPDPICARSCGQMPASRIIAPAQEMTRKIGPSYRSIIAHKLARGLDLMSQ